MAVYKLYPSKDSTIYSLFPRMNTGIDEIIEATTTAFSPSTPFPQVSRFLIQWSSDELVDIVDNTIGSSDFSASFKSYLATATGVNIGGDDNTAIDDTVAETTKIEAWPIAQSWRNGTGKYLDQPLTENGVAWAFRIFSGSGEWAINNASGVTGSYSGSNEGGGAWYTSSLYYASQELTYGSDLDINMDVTNVTKHWYSGSKGLGGLFNGGLIIKQTGSQEFVSSLNQQVELKFFSIDTHTIYPPHLELKWQDAVYSTGSSTGSLLTSTNAYVSLENNPGVFYSGSINRFRINARPKFPTRVFTTSSLYTTQHFFPSSSNTHFAIKDLDTNEFIVDFDQRYTAVSADENGCYFDVYMNGLEPERYYKILLKTTISGSTRIFDNDYYFKVING